MKEHHLAIRASTLACLFCVTGAFTNLHLRNAPRGRISPSLTTLASRLHVSAPSSFRRSGKHCVFAGSIAPAAPDDFEDGLPPEPATPDTDSPTSTPFQRIADSKQAVPTLAALLRFTIPTLGIWLAGPIMSLVDTSVVGLSSDLELAGMGPATNLCDSFIYLFTFLAVATTNLLAGALADGDEAKSQTVVSHALAIALGAGILVMLVIEIAGKSMLAATIGADGPLLIPVALKYTNIRALGAPFVLVGMVAQSSLLGAKDSVTPLLVTLGAGAINLILDMTLVSFGKCGIAGAAAATVVAEMVGTVVLLRALKRSQGPRRFYPFIALSSPVKDIAKFFTFAGPVFFALFGKSLCYTSLGIAAQMMGAVPLAAHQVMLRCFFFFTTFGDSLSTTAQAFLPGFLVDDNKLAIGKVVRRLVSISLGVGGLNAMLAGLLPSFFPGLFTTSAAIVGQMHLIAPWLSLCLLAHACTMALEGTLLAERELRFLASSYAINTLLVLVGLRRLQHVAAGIQGVWACLLYFQVSRCIIFALRLLSKHGLLQRARRRASRMFESLGGRTRGHGGDDARIGGRGLSVVD